LDYDRQIEAARVAMTRSSSAAARFRSACSRTSRSQRSRLKPVWARARSAGSLGGGWRPGKILFEMEGVAQDATEAMRLASHKLPLRYRVCKAPRCALGTTNDELGSDYEIRKSTQPDSGELRHQEHELGDQLFKLKFQLNMGQTESLKKIRGLRKDIHG